jgi:hypothetical protein
MSEFKISQELAQKLGIELKKNMIAQIRATGSISSGALINSVNIEIKQNDEGGYGIALLENDYITNLDEGRKRGKYAPIKALEEWVKSKGLASNSKQVTSIAWAINNKIKKEGIKPRKITEKTMEQTLPFFDTLIQQIVDVDLEKYINEQLKDL